MKYKELSQEHKKLIGNNELGNEYLQILKDSDKKYLEEFEKGCLQGEMSIITKEINRTIKRIDKEIDYLNSIDRVHCSFCSKPNHLHNRAEYNLMIPELKQEKELYELMLKLDAQDKENEQNE
jgi:hypothetical protein